MKVKLYANLLKQNENTAFNRVHHCARDWAKIGAWALNVSSNIWNIQVYNIIFASEIENWMRQHDNTKEPNKIQQNNVLHIQLLSSHFLVYIPFDSMIIIIFIFFTLNCNRCLSVCILYFAFCILHHLFWQFQPRSFVEWWMLIEWIWMRYDLFSVRCSINSLKLAWDYD